MAVQEAAGSPSGPFGLREKRENLEHMRHTIPYPVFHLHAGFSGPPRHHGRVFPKHFITTGLYQQGRQSGQISINRGYAKIAAI
jgi:hypothetical protein